MRSYYTSIARGIPGFQPLATQLLNAPFKDILDSLSGIQKGQLAEIWWARSEAIIEEELLRCLEAGYLKKLRWQKFQSFRNPHTVIKGNVSLTAFHRTCPYRNRCRWEVRLRY
jgi:hypothetical protein